MNLADLVLPRSKSFIQIFIQDPVFLIYANGYDAQT